MVSMSGHGGGDAIPGWLVLDVGAWGAQHGEFDLRVSPEYTDELRQMLTEARLDFSDVMEFSAGSTLDVIAVTIGTGGITLAVSNVIIAFINRHRDKVARFTIGDKSIDLGGQSTQEVERLAKMITELDNQNREQWERTRQLGMSNPSDEGTDHDGS